MAEGDQVSLDRHLEWLYGRGGVYETAGQPCLCEHAYKSLGRWPDGVSAGKGWVRITTHPDCPHHGTKAEQERRERHRR